MDNADRLYDEILNIQPDNPDALHLKGLIASQSGNYESAIEFICKAIKIMPDFQEFHNNLALIHLEHGNIHESIKCSNNAIKINPNIATPHFNIGNTFFRLAKYDEAVTSYKNALRLDPSNDAAAYNLGNVYKELDDLGNAKIYYEKTIAIAPGHGDAHINLGIALHDLGFYEESLVICNQAVSLVPDSPIAHHNLALAYSGLDQSDEAIQACIQAIKLKADAYWTYNLLGTIYLNYWKLDKAEDAFRKAIEIKSDDPEILNNLGHTLVLQRKLGEAKHVIKKAIQFNPDSPTTHNDLGVIYHSLGQIDKAVSQYNKALELQPDFAQVYYSLSIIKKYSRDDQDVIDKIMSILGNNDICENDEVLLYFALGKIYNDCREYRKAFKHYDKGNSLKYKHSNSDPESYRYYMDNIISSYSAELIATKSAYGNTSDVPVFIVGMPRSGTSLIEQIIASHPLVFGAGELPFIGGVPDQISKHLNITEHYPDSVKYINAKTVKNLANDYINKLQGYSENARRITDKMPLNAIHLGLINILFPNSKIIHCLRDPIDTCLSIYFQNFANTDTYVYNLTAIGLHYLQYKRIMEHWGKVLRIPILNIQYEELIDHQEAFSRRMIDYIGLDWDNSCLSFQNTDRAVETASVWQVRQPIYKTSVKRWKNYEPFIEPLIRIFKK